MTQLENFSQALHLLLAMSGLWLLCFKLFSDYRLDVLRDRLFAVRELLFDFAASGNVPFDHPGYTNLRVLINGLIRFAHRLTFSRILMGIIFQSWKGKCYSNEPLQEWNAALSELPEDVQIQLKNIHHTALILVVRHLITGSPVVLLLLTVFGIWSVMTGITRQLLLAFTNVLPGLDILQAQVMMADAEERHPERIFAHQH